MGNLQLSVRGVLSPSILPLMRKGLLKTARNAAETETAKQTDSGTETETEYGTEDENGIE